MIVRGAIVEAVLVHPLVVEELGHIVTDRVGEKDNTALAFLELLGSLHRRPHGSAAGATTQEAYRQGGWARWDR